MLLRFNFRCLAFLIMTQHPAVAQEYDYAAEDFFDEAPLILTVSRMTKPLQESPASVSVIDRDMIESSGMRDIADLFRLVPGFVVGYDSGHLPAVTYHGLGGTLTRQMQVLVDGRSVFIPSFGGVPWSNLPLLIEDIERIEIIRGPNTVTYGSNAFLATINIITRHAAEDLGAHYLINASNRNNGNIEDAYLRFGGQNRAFDWRLSLGGVHDDGFDIVNDSKRISKINLRFDWLNQSDQSWTFHMGSSDSVAGRGSSSPQADSTDIERDEMATNSYFNLQWEADWRSSTTIARLTQTRQTVFDNYEPPPFTLELGGNEVTGVTTFIDFDRTSERTEFELVHTDDINQEVRLVYGGSLRQDRVKSFSLLNDETYHSVESSRLFTALEWRLNPSWLLDIGAMLEDSSLVSPAVSPRVSLISNIDDRHALRMVASGAKRNPILYEAVGETIFTITSGMIGPVPLPVPLEIPRWQGNEDIEPEEIESFEIGLNSRWNQALSSDIKLFRYEISKHIVEIKNEVIIILGPIIDTIDVSTATNAHKTTVKGIEFETDYSPHKRLQLNMGFSLLDVESTAVDLVDTYPDKIAFISGRFKLNQRHEISSSFFYLDSINWSGAGNSISSAERLDLRYAFQFNHKTRFELIGQNLIEKFADFRPANLQDRVVYLRMTGRI